MNDLLSRMVARATGALSPVEPILASRYEPAHQVPAFAGQTEQAESAPVAAPRRRNNTQGRSHDLETASMPVSAVGSPEQKGKWQRGTQEFAQIPIVLGNAPLAAPRLDIETPKDGERTAESGVEEIKTELGRGASEIPTLAKSIEKEQQVARREHLVVAVSSTNEKSFQRGMASEAFAEPIAPSEVNVTIGAIEVRLASPPRPPVRKAPPTQPRVSLDDYLGRRNGRPR